MVKLADLERAIEIAIIAHKGQVDQAGDKYIYHPLRVMSKMQDNDRRIVAILHDIIEDTDIKANDLVMEGFSEDVIINIVVLTKPKWLNYFEYIQHIISFDKKYRKNRYENSIALDVKLADLRDNMDFTRLHEVLRRDVERNKKYSRAKKMFDDYLMEVFING